MVKRFIVFAFLAIPSVLCAQEEAVTSSGKTVILYPDSTWKLKIEPQQVLALATDSSGVTLDSLSTPLPAAKPKKEFKETSTGFRGFLKPEIHLPPLPEQSEGVYVFRVTVNKEGIVKQVITTQHGPNGQAEVIMRNTINRLKYRWDNTPIPPLTEGIIKIEVPAN